MKLPLVTLDVFTSTKLTGNPLAIVMLPSLAALSQSIKQEIAKELNLSETVFLPQDALSNNNANVHIDIFTPLAEIPFAGHPTIGAAFYLLKYLGLPVNALIPKAGQIPIFTGRDSAVVSAEIAHNFRVHARRFPTDLTVQGQAPVVSIVKGMTFILVHMADIAALGKPTRGLKDKPYNPDGLDPDFNVGLTGTYFYVPTGRDNNGRQCIRTRMIGSREDPATGSAASALSCYLALEEPKKEGKGPFEFVLTQGVEMGRKSTIEIRVERTDDGSAIHKVLLQGTAVKVIEGVIDIST
ncbi:MAG: hypothetical protein Q9160_003906 [Pyrenula sp. 1 TL-2023]